MSEQTPWYRDGLCFSCTQCGDCCTGEPGVVWVTEEDIANIARVTGKTIGEIRLFHTRIVGGRLSLREHANGDCTFFDPEQRNCTIYQARPTQCRTWPFWKSHLDSPVAWEEVKRECPGAGRGEFFSLEEVERRAAEMDI
jgi:uncharacterized protein